MRSTPSTPRHSGPRARTWWESTSNLGRNPICQCHPRAQHKVFCPPRQGHFGLSRRENPMEYATLGNTGLLASKLCFGTMTFGDGSGYFKAIGAVSQTGADELVKTSIDRGLNFFDTPDNYV